jgi:hypothetical protein
LQLGNSLVYWHDNWQKATIIYLVIALIIYIYIYNISIQLNMVWSRQLKDFELSLLLCCDIKIYQYNINPTQKEKRILLVINIKQMKAWLWGSICLGVKCLLSWVQAPAMFLYMTAVWDSSRKLGLWSDVDKL